MFEEYSPFEDKMLRILDKEGNIVDEKHMPGMSDVELTDAYKLMLYARTADLRAVSYQRQGRMFTYPPNLGQEAVAAGTGFAMREIDWLVPAYRELGAYLKKGASMKDILMIWYGREDGSKFPGASNMLTIAVPIASQIPHAVGIGFALKYKNKDGVVFTYFGDGATSKGDFHEGLNFAGVWKAPVVFVCQNNQYAISLPVHEQTAAKNIAVKAAGYGVNGIRVDGNDFLAVYAASKEASKRAEKGEGPTLIEAVTYRMGAHTTSDDPKKYRTDEEEEKWKERDPLKRYRLFLEKQGLWEEDKDEELKEQYGREIDSLFLEVEKYPKYTLDEVFEYQYKEMPDELKRQKAEYERYMNRKEAAV